MKTRQSADRNSAEKDVLSNAQFPYTPEEPSSPKSLTREAIPKPTVDQNIQSPPSTPEKTIQDAVVEAILDQKPVLAPRPAAQPIPRTRPVPLRIQIDPTESMAALRLNSPLSAVYSPDGSFESLPPGYFYPPPMFMGPASAPTERNIRKYMHKKHPALSSSPLRTEFQCKDCGKVYKHPSCLAKHRWEHTEHWKESSKFSLSKHQQVQMLEAASVLTLLRQ